MKRSLAVLLLLLILSNTSFSIFKEDERSIYTVISSTAYTAGKKGIYLGPEGIAFGLSEHTQTNLWGFLGYGDKQDISMGIGIGLKQGLAVESDSMPAISFDMSYHTIVGPDKVTLLPPLPQPYNIGSFINAYTFGISISKKMDEKFFLHSAIKLYDYDLSDGSKLDFHLISVSAENRFNEWMRNFTEINFDAVNSVLNGGIKLDLAPTDTIRVSLGYMAGTGQNGLFASQMIIGAALQF